MAIHKVRPGQSLTDIAIEKYGSAEGVHIILEDNRAALNNSIDTVPAAGTSLIIRDTNPLNAQAAFISAELSRNNKLLGSAPNQPPSGYVDLNYVLPNYVE